MTAEPPLEWWTGTSYAYIAENYPYTHLIRADDDPDETAPRGKGHTMDWKKLNTKKEERIEDWADAIVEHLSDSIPRTFNRIAVELTGKTADVAGGMDPDKGLWLAVERSEIAYTPSAPILFKRYRKKRGRDGTTSKDA